MLESHEICESNCILTEDQERMRRDLRYHFMNPKEKWQAKGTLPIKMILIVIKIMLITIQVIVFSQINSNQVTFVEGAKTTFKHLFLKDWLPSHETLPYPPTSGRFAVYKTDDFYKSANHAFVHYYNLENETVGPYGFSNGNKALMKLCVTHYKSCHVLPYNSSYVFSSEIVHNCFKLVPMRANSTSIFDVKAFLQSKNFTINFDGLVGAALTFSLQSVQLNSFEVDQLPDCYLFDLTINYDNSLHNGQVLVKLHANVTELHCDTQRSLISKTATGTILNNALYTLDSFVLLLSVVSLILCLRSFVRLLLFWKKAKDFFLAEMGVDISKKRNHFWNISYFIIFVGDVFIISGTIVKLQMFSPWSRGMSSFTMCTYFMGLGLFFAYVTLLRYFSYFPKSSILVNTIRVALPPMVRFSLCSVILYLAFALLGWIILGPYHLKFRTFDGSIACLFSLMMGDDIFVTLSVIRKENIHVYLFSQLYIYFFLILFIFVVLNLILTIIIEAYDNVKNNDSNVYQIDSFWNFINSCPESSKSPLYKSDKMQEKSRMMQRHSRMARKFVDLFCCCIGQEGHTTEIQRRPDPSNADEELSSSFPRNDLQRRLYSVMTNDYNSFGTTNRCSIMNFPN